MRKLNAIAAAVILLSSQGILAQESRLEGVIKDATANLRGAQIHVLGSKFTTTTDYQGHFELNQLPLGKHQIEISYLGYQSKIIDIEITQDGIKDLGILTLSGEYSEIEEVVALGQIQRGEMAAANSQKQANRIINVISADGIGKLPDRNAAEAVQRIPGISIERDQGEGRFVAVRGLPSQWSSASINGDRLPTAEEETTSRATAFDFFPSELIEFVEVSKAITPDMEGDAIGGNVNFITKKAPDSQMLKVSVAGGKNQLADGGNYSANVLYGDRSENDKFGFLVNATAWKRDWATDNYEPRRGNDGLGIRRLELRDYTGTRETYGLNGSMEYKLEQGKISASAMYGTLIDDETHYKHRMRFDKDRVEVQHIRNELITQMTGFELQGEHYFGFDTTFDWKLSSYENEFRYGNTPNANDNSYFVVRFDQKNVGYEGLEDRGTGKNYAYNSVDGGTDPWNNISNHLPNGFSMDPSQTKLSWVELYKVAVNEKDKIVAQANLAYQLDESLEVKFGVKFRDKERNASYADEFYAWDETKGDTPTLADFNLSDQPGRNDYLDELNNNYHNQFSQVANTNDLADFWNENKQNFILDKSESALIENGGALGRNFDVNESHTSVYGMATYQYGDNWELLSGLRLTQTDTKVSGYTYLTDENKVVATEQSNDYLSVLPALHIKYSSDDYTNYRLALTRSFARPDFGALSPGATYSEADNQLKSGNPELDPTYSNNLDLMVEHFFDGVGVVSAGVFYKDIQDPIFQASSIGNYKSQQGVNIVRPENGASAWLGGVEMTFNRDLGFLANELEYFGIMANVTLMDSQMSIPDRDDKVSIPRQADNLYNFTVYFDNNDFTARLAINHKGEYIQEHGSEQQSDSFYGDNTSVDFSASYFLSENAMVFLELNNLTNEPLKYYLGNEDRPLQVEYYGVRGMLGVTYSF